MRWSGGASAGGVAGRPGGWTSRRRPPLLLHRPFRSLRSPRALVHQEILENAYRCLSVLIGVFSPFFKQVCCYAPLWRKQVPYDRLEFFLALQNCCNKP